MFRNRIFEVFHVLILLAVFCTRDVAAAPGDRVNMRISTDEKRSSELATLILNSNAVMFTEDVGQYGEDNQRRFQVRGSNSTVWLSKDGLSITVYEKLSSFDLSSSRVTEEMNSFFSFAKKNVAINNENLHEGVNIKLSFPGANPTPHLESFNRLETHVSYFIGNDRAKWRTDVPIWGGVRYKDLYPGIDMEISSKNGHLTQSLIVHKGANLDAVQMRVEGVSEINLEGNLLRFITDIGEYTLPLLRVSGVDNAKRSFPKVAGNLIFSPFSNLQGEAENANSQSVSSDLLYATLLGGSNGGDNRGYRIAVDASGAAYVTGTTNSSDFPTTPGAFDSSCNNGFNDYFVAKFNTDGSALDYATFIGGNGQDIGNDIAVDTSGSAYVTGETDSSNFPSTSGVFETCSYANMFNAQAFVVKLNTTGSELTYSTCIGGSASDYGYGIAVGANGVAYITGSTTSSDFPITSEAFKTSNTEGSYDAFVVKLNTTGSTLIYATYFGGSGDDLSNGIAIDTSGAAYITGSTQSLDFPATPGAFDSSFYGTSDDAFVAKLNMDGSNLAYATLLGGSGHDGGSSLAVDTSGAAYITGATGSSDFPITPTAFDRSFNGYSSDAFLVKLNVAGSALTYSTLLGGTGEDWGNDIIVNARGEAYITGETSSSDFPTLPGRSI